MTSKLFPVFVLMLTATLEGTHSQNATAQVRNEVTQLPVTLSPNKTTPKVTLMSIGVGLENKTVTEPISIGKNPKAPQNESSTPNFVTKIAKNITATSSPEVLGELERIFKIERNNSSETSEEDDFNNSNSTLINCHGGNLTDFICFEESLNDTDKTNYTLIAEAMEGLESQPAFRLQKSAAVAAAVFLLSAIAGYLSCVTYRRYLQRKYGDSQRVAPEDVYDTTDLRYFEI